MTRALKRTRTGARKRDMRRKSQGNVDLRPGLNRMVEIKEDAAGTDVLGFSLKFDGILESDSGRKAHIEAPHHPSVKVRPFSARELVSAESEHGGQPKFQS